MGQKICSKCRQTLTLDKFQVVNRILKSGRLSPYIQSWCKSCQNERSRQNKLRLSDDGVTKGAAAKRHKRLENRDNIEYLFGIRLGKYKRRSNVPSDLTVGYLVALYNKQEGRCFYTGRPLDYRISNQSYDDFLSLDRLDPSEGYVKGNVVWCSNFANTMKRTLTVDEFYDMIELILTSKGKQKQLFEDL